MVKFFKTYGELVRNIGQLFLIIFVIILVMMFILPIFPPAYNFMLSIGIDKHVYTILLIAQFSLPLGIILYILPRFFYHIDYHTVDFGYFSTQIHDSFVGIPSKRTTGLNGQIVHFTLNGRSIDKVVSKSQMTSGGRQMIKYKQRVYGTDYFEVYYLHFSSKEKRLSSQDKILNSYKEDWEYCSTNYYAHDNILIVFQYHTFGKGVAHAYPNIKWLVVRKAAKNVKLNPHYTEEKPETLPKNKLAMDVLMNPQSDFLKQSEALDDISDEEDFIRIIKNSPHSYARTYAFLSLKDKPVLGEIIKDLDSDTLSDLIHLIKDNKALFEIAKNTKDSYIQREAFEKITDSDLRSELLKIL